MADSRGLSAASEFIGLGILAATYIVNAMDRLVFPTLLPTMSAEYGFSLVVGGLLATIFTLGLGAAGLPSGLLLDRFSRKTVLIAGVCLYSICTVLTSFSVGAYDMAVYRIASGVGEALQIAATFTIVGSYFARRCALNFGLLNFAFGAGAFLGPWWGARLLAQSGSWRLPLLVYGVLGLGGAVAILLFVPTRFAEWGRHGNRAAASGGKGTAETSINRNMAIVSLVAVAIGVSGYGYLGLYPTYLRTQLHFSAETAGAAAGMFGVGALLGPCWGYLGDRIDQKWLTILALAALGSIGYALFNVAATPLWHGVLSFLQGSVLSGCLFVNSYSLMQRSTGLAATGKASGLFVTSLYLPAAFSGYLFATLVNSFGWGEAALAQMSLLLAAPILAMTFFDLERTNSSLRQNPTLNRSA